MIFLENIIFRPENALAERALQNNQSIRTNQTGRLITVEFHTTYIAQQNCTKKAAEGANFKNGGDDGYRTRDLLRDRQAL